MGLFGKLFGEKGPELPDRVWLTGEGKLADLCGQIRADQELGKYPITVAHFPDTEALVQRVFIQQDITVRHVRDFEAIRSGDVSRWRAAGATLLFNSAILSPAVKRGEVVRAKMAGGSPVRIHLVEHFPTASRDRHVLNLDKALALPVDFVCYTALDEPWLAAFGGDQIRGVIQRLGMTEDQVLEHRMIDQAILNAQRKLEKRVRRDIPCASCEEWMARHVSAG